MILLNNLKMFFAMNHLYSFVKIVAEKMIPVIINAIFRQLIRLMIYLNNLIRIMLMLKKYGEKNGYYQGINGKT